MFFMIPDRLQGNQEMIHQSKMKFPRYVIQISMKEEQRVNKFLLSIKNRLQGFLIRATFMQFKFHSSISELF